MILLANLGARGDEPDNWRMLAERFAEAGVDGLELNFCCPNLDVDALRAKPLRLSIRKVPLTEALCGRGAVSRIYNRDNATRTGSAAPWRRP